MSDAKKGYIKVRGQVPVGAEHGIRNDRVMAVIGQDHGDDMSAPPGHRLAGVWVMGDAGEKVKLQRGEYLWVDDEDTPKTTPEAPGATEGAGAVSGEGPRELTPLEAGHLATARQAYGPIFDQLDRLQLAIDDGLALVENVAGNRQLDPIGQAIQLVEADAAGAPLAVYADAGEGFIAGIVPGKKLWQIGDDAPAGITMEHLIYLDELRESGVVNMLGAGPYLRRDFPELDRPMAGAVLRYWMDTFGERHADG